MPQTRGRRIFQCALSAALRRLGKRHWTCHDSLRGFPNFVSGNFSAMKRFALRSFTPIVALAMIAFGTHAQTKHAMTFDDLISMQRVSDPHISPDGKWVAFTLATPDKEANRNASNIWVIPAAGGGRV